MPTSGLTGNGDAGPWVTLTLSPTRITTGPGMNNRRQGGEGVMLAGLHEFS
jgi:hypothetical protein